MSLNLRAIGQIAKRDFLGFYYSAKAPVLVFVFLFIVGVFFYGWIIEIVESQQKAMGMGGGPGVDQLLFALYSMVHFLMILIVPGVTMGSFADEVKAHTYTLLQSSPISSADIILGKFCALFGVVASAFLLTSVYPVYLYLYSEIQLPVLAMSYLGVLLLVASQVTFGIFISATTVNQLLAFLFTLLGLFFLFILSFIAPKIAGTGVSGDFLRYIATSVHLEPFLKGLFSLQHLSYFLLFILLFLSLTAAVIDSRRWR